MTGVPLLLISAGGTSTVVAMYSIGAAQRVISIYNKDKLKREAEESL
jgi:cell division protein FtsW